MATIYLMVDDDGKFRKLIPKLLGIHDVEVRALEPQKEIEFLDQHLAEGDVNGVILDYKLSYLAQGVSYNCPALAGWVRDYSPDVPVVVLSGAIGNDLDAAASYDRTKSLYDLKLSKSELADNAEPIALCLKSLASGYATLREALGHGQVQPDVTVVKKMLGLDDDPEGIVDWLIAESNGEVYRAAQCILQLLRWSGPLQDLVRAAVWIGVAGDHAVEATDALEEARYNGPFGGVHERPRFWTHRLASCTPPDDANEAVCEVSGGTADVVCDSCGRSVAGNFTLGVDRLGAPSIVRHGRVCGFCLENPDGLNALRVPSDSRCLIDGVVAETRGLQGDV